MTIDSREDRPVGDKYFLETGERGAARLELLHEVYGPATERVCRAQGVAKGWRIADIGCGTGQVSCWLGGQVGDTGYVTGVDVSTDQLSIACHRASRLGLSNVSFAEGSAYALELPAGQFDFVFCRALLCHLQRPLDALYQMAALLRPGGILVAQDLLFTSIFTDPVSAAYQRFIRIGMRVGESLGVDYCLGSRLHQLFREVGLEEVDVVLDQPCFLRGERKRFWEYTWIESGPRMVGGKFLTQEEFDELAREITAIGTDDHMLVAQACMPSVRGTKPA